MSTTIDRRDFLVRGLGALAAGTVLSPLVQDLAAQATSATTSPAAARGAQPAKGALPPMTVYKSPTCGCCGAWVDHARAEGFTVKTVDTDDLPKVKREMGVPSDLESCHTVVVGSYLVEGHVPAKDVKRMLATKPAIRGIAVPGMPIGSPGMEQGDPKNYHRYNVVAFTVRGARSVFAKY